MIEDEVIEQKAQLEILQTKMKIKEQRLMDKMNIVKESLHTKDRRDISYNYLCVFAFILLFLLESHVAWIIKVRRDNSL